MDDNSAVMDDGEAEVAVEEVEEVADETTDEVEAEADDSLEEEASDDSEDQEEDSEEEEFYEFDFGGNKKQFAKGNMPPELAEELQTFGKNLESAHTKRSQEVAEHKKSLEAREQAVQKLQGMHGDTLQEYSKGLQLRQDIAELEKVDIQTLWQTNPDDARKISDAISQKTAEFNQTVNRVSQLEHAQAQHGQQEMARRANEGVMHVEKRIPGFAKEKASEVINYVGETYGIPKQEAEAWPLNPAGAEMAYKAMLYDRMQKKANPKTVKKKVTQLKPVKSTKGGKGGTGKSSVPSDKDSVDAWVRKREAQIRKREMR